MAAARPLSIGAVVRDLADEFPDLTISKVRFLEAEGLVTPVRTGSGYRQFTPADVDRLRWVLRAQRDRFWPLATIREALAAADRGLVPGAPGGPASVPDDEHVDDEGTGPGDVTDLDPEGLLARGPLRVSADELADAAGLTPAEVADLTGHGVLRPRDDGSFGAEDVRAARAAAVLARFGLEGRHLRSFRAAADREVGLLEQATAGLRGAEGEADRAEALRHALLLHAALVRGGLGTEV